MTDARKPAKKPAGHAGAVISVIAAIAAGIYFFATDKGKKRRAALRGWTVKARGEVLEKLETAGDIGWEAYEQIVEQVMKQYKKAKNVDLEAWDELRNELLEHWEAIERDLKKAAKKATK